MNDNAYIPLPFSFDVERLLSDLRHCEAKHWQLHFNAKDFAGNWSSISLRSASGREEDVYAFSNEGSYKNTPLLEECPYFSHILSLFQCQVESMRLMALAPGSQIKEHTDMEGGYADGFARIHIPICTNEKVSFVVNGKRLPALPGSCWYADFSLPHSVNNEGDTVRVHLVIDALRNAWTDGLMGQAGYDFELERKKKEPSIETKRLMLAQLRLLDNEGARQLVAQLEKELGEGAV